MAKKPVSIPIGEQTTAALLISAAKAKETHSALLHKHQDELKPTLELINTLETEIEKRVLANVEEGINRASSKDRFVLESGAGYECGLEVTREIIKDFDQLRKLAPLLKPEEYSKTVYQDPMPKQEDLPWKADARKLNSLVKSHGEKSPIGKIISAGLTYREKSRKVFILPVEAETTAPPIISATGDVPF